MNKPTYLCIKWGTKYPSSYVNKLYNAINKFSKIDFDFICMTDDFVGIDENVIKKPLPNTGLDESIMDAKKGGETWRKIGIFQKENYGNIENDIIFLDLDVVIMSDLTPLFKQNSGKFIVIQDWMEKQRKDMFLQFRPVSGNTSVFRFNPKKHEKVFLNYKNNQHKILEKYRIEQQYVTDYLKQDTCFWDKVSVQSFKRSCRRIFPFNLFMEPKKPNSECKILVFHGHPLPEEAIKGFTKTNIFKRNVPTTWLKKYW